MRRLPIYFLIDVSESMIGEPIEQVQEGIATIIKELNLTLLHWKLFGFPSLVLLVKVR